MNLSKEFFKTIVFNTYYFVDNGAHVLIRPTKLYTEAGITADEATILKKLTGQKLDMPYTYYIDHNRFTGWTDIKRMIAIPYSLIAIPLAEGHLTKVSLLIYDYIANVKDSHININNNTDYDEY